MLLLDKVDVFLQKRNLSDIRRNAIVFDKYPTTNIFLNYNLFNF